MNQKHHHIHHHHSSENQTRQKILWLCLSSIKKKF